MLFPPVNYNILLQVVTEHDTLRTFVPTLLREDDVSVLTETVRLLRAALGLEIEISDRWRKVLPDDTVERLIHIIQVFILYIFLVFTLVKFL